MEVHFLSKLFGYYKFFRYFALEFEEDIEKSFII